MSGQEAALAYLLHLWPEEGEDPTVWRVSLQDLNTQSRRGFASLDELFAYLETLSTQNRASSIETRQKRSK
jgi:hypothetical protein